MMWEKEVQSPKICKFPGKKILIVEDKKINREIVKNILLEAGVTVYTAENGEEAIELIQNHADIDMIFMDIRMPVMSGDVATDIIRKMNRVDCKKMPIIAMSATSPEEEVLCAGINDWMAKPVEPNRIYKCLEKFLNLT